MDESVAFAGAYEQARLVRNGEVTPTELVELYLGRIERLDPKLNAYRVVFAERALAEAQEVERRIAAGEGPAMPLGGVPIAVKDVEDIEGEVTAFGSAAFDRPASADSEHVRRLRQAGAIVLGKTNVPELTIYGFTESSAFGVTRNPWDTNRSPGGSSGGSAAALAAGLCAAASASDGAGSIRIPAAFTGLFGLKPQRDRIPLAPARDNWHGLSVLGALTRTVRDTALWLDVAANPPSIPPDPGHSFVEAVMARPTPLRIAYSTKAPLIMAPPKVADEVAAAVESTAQLLRDLGHRVERCDPDWGAIGMNLAPRYLNGIAAAARSAPHPERFEKRTQGIVRLGRLQGGPLLRRSRRREPRDARRLLRIFNDFDVLITPVTGEPPIEIGRWAGKGAVRTLLGMTRTYPFCVPWNHLGVPAASVPAGFTPSGLPLAVQLVGRRDDEGTLLRLAAQLEEARPWSDRRPPVS
ncbi:MAG TPA: amidase [Solirubrobacterales bacterium]|jgi:amidase